MSRKQNLWVVGCSPVAVLAMMWVCAGLWAEQSGGGKAEAGTGQESPFQVVLPVSVESQTEAITADPNEAASGGNALPDKAAAPMADGLTNQENVSPAGKITENVAEAAKADKTGESGSTAGKPEKAGQYWHRHYHPQLTQGVFSVMQYPYYRGGEMFSPEPEVKKAEPSEPDNQMTGQSESLAGAKPAGKTADTPAAALNGETPPAPATATAAGSGQNLYHLKKIMDLIYQWRQVNESEGTTLEIMRSEELTRTSTHIYRRDASLAIQVKRTVGQIGVINGRFDAAQREAVGQLARGEYDRAVITRLEKLLADLKADLEKLAEQNDKIGVALGVGKFERTTPWSEYTRRIDYSHLMPENQELPNTAKK